MGLAPLKVEIIFDSSALKRGIAKATRDTSRGTKKMDNNFKTLNKTIRRVGIAIGTIFAARTIKSFLGAGKSIETIKLSLEGLLGSSEKAEKAFKGIQLLAIDVTQGIDDLARGFQQLSSASLESIENLEGLANVATLMDRSVQEAAQAIRSLETETLRNTLGLNNVSTAAGNFTATLRDGTVITAKTRREFQKLLLETFRLGKGYKGVARGGAKLFGSALTTIVNSVRVLSAKIRESLAPALQKIARDFFKVSEKAGEWVTANKDIISEKTLAGYERLKKVINSIANAFGRIDTDNLKEGFAKGALIIPGVVIGTELAGRVGAGALAGRKTSQGLESSVIDSVLDAGLAVQLRQSKARLKDTEFLSSLTSVGIEDLKDEISDLEESFIAFDMVSAKLNKSVRGTSGIIGDVGITLLAVKSGFKAIGPAIGRFLSGLLRFSGVGAIITSIVFAIGGLIQGFGDILKAVFNIDIGFEELVKGLRFSAVVLIRFGKLIGAVFTTVAGLVRTFTNVLFAGFTNLFSLILKGIRGLLNTIADLPLIRNVLGAGIRTANDEVLSPAIKRLEAITDELAINAEEAIKDIGRNLSDIFTGPLTDFENAVLGVKELESEIRNGIAADKKAREDRIAAELKAAEDKAKAEKRSRETEEKPKEREFDFGRNISFAKLLGGPGAELTLLREQVGLSSKLLENIKGSVLEITPRVKQFIQSSAGIEVIIKGLLATMNSNLLSPEQLENSNKILDNFRALLLVQREVEQEALSFKSARKQSIEEFIVLQERLNLLVGKGVLSEQERDLALEKGRKVRTLTGGDGEFSQFTAQFGENLASTAQDALVSGITQGFQDAIESGSFDDFAVGLAETVSQALLAAVVSALAEAAAKKIGDLLLDIGLKAGSAAAATPKLGGTVSQGQVLRFARGGIVPDINNRPFADSVPALLQPGERILTRAENRRFDGLNEGMNVAVTINTQSLDPSNAADVIAAQADVIERVIISKLQNNSTIRRAIGGR